MNAFWLDRFGFYDVRPSEFQEMLMPIGMGYLLSVCAYYVLGVHATSM